MDCICSIFVVKIIAKRNYQKISSYRQRSIDLTHEAKLSLLAEQVQFAANQEKEHLSEMEK